VLPVTLILLIVLIIYGGISYIHYRIIHKFMPHISLKECLIPIWNTYLLLRVAVNNPVSYFWYVILVSAISALSEGSSLGVRIVSLLGILIGTVLWAQAMGLIAQKLGKSFWLFAIMTVIPFANFIAFCILALDNSEPTKPSQPLKALVIKDIYVE